MNRYLKTAALSLLLAFSTVGVTYAATAYADGRVRVKEEPRRSSDTLGYLRDGQRVEVENCRRGWCRIQLRGPDGYVDEDDLEFRRGGGGRDDPSVEFCIGGGGPGGGGGFGFGRFCIQN